MSNFVFSSIVVLYLYYNGLAEECKGQKLSVLILVSQLDGKVKILPVLRDRISTSEVGYIFVIRYMYLFPQYVTKSPIFIIHLLLLLIIYHRWRYCKGQKMSV